MGSKDSNRRACGGERAPRVGIYGVTNVGKSSLLNRITGQQAAVVSPVAGTTTDPVRRVCEVAGYGPVIFVDTAGIDDEGSEVGRLRVAKTWQTLSEVDLAVVLLADARPSGAERRLLDRIRANDVPYLLCLPVPRICRRRRCFGGFALRFRGRRMRCRRFSASGRLRRER